MPKRVLLVNKFYYPRGGDCVVVLNTQALLREHGVEAEVFAMRYPDNLPARYQEDFPCQVDFGGDLSAKWLALCRTMGWGDVKSCFERVLSDFKPDVVHLHNVHSYLSPVVARLAHDHGLRVVWTLHDYKLLCPSYTCLRQGDPCELCFAGGKSHVLRHRCMKDSLVASAVAWLEARQWSRAALQSCTDTWICPSEFMASKMRQGGFSADRLTVLSNFIDPVKLGQLKALDDNPTPRDYYCYVGRLSAEKGVDTLLQAASQLPYRLRVGGDGPLRDELRLRYGHCGHIEFLGQLDAAGVSRLLSGARLCVMPSECYENNPLSVIEALCAGTSVVGTHMGGIPELLSSESGVICPARDPQALAQAIDSAWQRVWRHADIAAESRRRFSPQPHYEALARIYGL